VKKNYLALGAILLAHCCYAQNQPADAARHDTSTPKTAVTGAVRPYRDVITGKALTRKGLFTVHQIDDKWYFEIGDSLIGREMLAVTRYIKTPGGAGIYGGEIANQESMYWQKAPNNKLLLRVSLYINAADSSDNIFRAVASSNEDPIVAAFDIKAVNPAGGAAVIDVTDFFKGDNPAVSVSANSKKRMNLGAIAADRSFISQINVYPVNTEVRTVKTFAATPPTLASLFAGARAAPAAMETGVVTLQMNTSFILLPAAPLRKRLFDPRVGFFADQFTSYSDSSQGSDAEQYIVRWRLEPKDEDRAKMLRGELVEPKKPIVYYIDPATPKKWRPYLIAGINDWQKAFEQAGFKNAIVGKEWPEGDSTMSLEDARFSVIRYFASDITNAYGPNVHDPRSGEILESHIGWYHNVMKLVHDWYMIQAGAIDPKARTMKFDDSLMGQLIRFVSSHEIGHTLGLRHNMGASSQTPVEKLRDKAWVEANGHTVSIMDYARFNYVAQPEDSISEKGIFPRIGMYDKWAIQWGYKPIAGTTDEQGDRKVLNRWIVDSLTSNPRLWFGGEGGASEPRSQMEDLGDDAMKAGTYGIKNLKRVLVHLPEWTKEEGDTYRNLAEMYKALTDQYSRYMLHAAKNIGGMYTTAKSVEQPGVVSQPVPRAVLKEMVAFYDKELFQTPDWLYNKEIIGKLGIRPLSHLNALQDRVLSNIMSAAALLQVLEMANISDDPYPADEYLTDLKNSIWKELKLHTPISIYRRNLQDDYLENLSNVLKPVPPPAGAMFYIIQPGVSKSDVPAIIRAHLVALKKEINAALPMVSDRMTKEHLQEELYKIDRILNPDK
jgi:hypothetical protein